MSWRRRGLFTAILKSLSLSARQLLHNSALSLKMMLFHSGFKLSMESASAEVHSNWATVLKKAVLILCSLTECTLKVKHTSIILFLFLPNKVIIKSTNDCFQTGFLNISTVCHWLKKHSPTPKHWNHQPLRSCCIPVLLVLTCWLVNYDSLVYGYRGWGDALLLVKSLESLRVFMFS